MTLKILSIEESVEFKGIQDAQISPDGAFVAFVVAERYKVDTKLPRSTIWLVSANDGDAHKLTGGPRADQMPRWSPDGQWLAFLSDRSEDGQSQIYLLPRNGGEASPLTNIRGGIEDMQWSADGQRICFLKYDAQTDEERHKEESKDDAIVFEEAPKYARVYAVELADKTVTQLTHGDWHAWEFNLSPDGRQLAFVAADNPFEWSWYQSRIALAPPSQSSPVTNDATGEGAKKSEGVTLHQTKRQLARPLISPDGQWVAFITSTWSDRGVTSGDLYVVSSDGRETRNLTPGYGGSVSWMVWSADAQTLIFMAIENLDATFCEVHIATGQIKKLWSGAVGVAPRNQPAFSATHDQQSFAVVRESHSEPPDVWLARREGDALTWRRLTTMFPDIETYAPIETKSIHWKAADGLMIQGFLLKPVGYEPGRRYPLVVMVHGGPTSLHPYSFQLLNRWVGLLAAHGIAVLLPNPRGSVGWGLQFAEANVGDMGGKDFGDVMAGADTCVAMGIADEKRLGIAGWSYGGYMTMWTVSQTTRFKAAMAGAGISNWKSFHGLTKYPTFDTTFYRADPYDTDKEAAYELFSPLTYIKQIKTPTLITHGEKDPDVPVGQAFEFHRALKDHGVAAQLVIYPREKHGIVEKAHLIDLARRIVQWFVQRL